MCGIAGVIALTDRKQVPPGALAVMAAALVHRGPDDDGFLERPGLGLANRRLSIVGLHDGRQPLSNEDGSVSVVFNGELFDYPELRAELVDKGHRLVTHCDTEVIPHLWEDCQEKMLDRLRGQFALALWDERRQTLILARDRFGICPLYWTIQEHGQQRWLLFASEIRALLASGLVRARPEPRGIHHLFTFFALPGPVTCFEGIQLLQPGRYLRIRPNDGGVQENTYWEMDFADAGSEDPGHDPRRLVDGLETVLYQAVERRLRADVPVVSYLSGGVDSSLVVAMASRILGEPIPTFTVSVKDPRFNESRQAELVARHVGCQPVTVPYGPAEILRHYPRLIETAEAPVIDTSCAAMMLLAERVHANGYKVALTGEGADEWLAGYPWYRYHGVFGLLDVIPGLPLSGLARRLYLKSQRAPAGTWAMVERAEQATGGYNAWLDVHQMIGIAKLRLFSPAMLERLGDHLPYDDLQFDLPRMARWHPLNRSLAIGARILLPGMLLSAKGDRVAMHSSVETRYPFLDEAVFDFLAGVHPRWKRRGFEEKYLLKCVAERWLPREIAWRRKGMFRAPLDPFHGPSRPAFIDQLLSEEALRATGYFDPKAVQHWRRAFRNLWPGSHARTAMEMGLVGVTATQIWHHIYISRLAELPAWSAPAVASYRPSAKRSIAPITPKPRTPTLNLT